ncbi:hypothetical protein CLOM_g13810, partial [Closterium sp. NIES-68]
MPGPQLVQRKAPDLSAHLHSDLRPSFSPGFPSSPSFQAKACLCRRFVDSIADAAAAAAAAVVAPVDLRTAQLAIPAENKLFKASAEINS